MPFDWNPTRFSHPINVTPGDDVIVVNDHKELLTKLAENHQQRVLFDMINFEQFDETDFFKAVIQFEKDHPDLKAKWLVTHLPEMPFIALRYDQLVGLLHVDPSPEARKLLAELKFSKILFDESEGSVFLQNLPQVKEIYLVDATRVTRRPDKTFTIPIKVWDVHSKHWRENIIINDELEVAAITKPTDLRSIHEQHIEMIARELKEELSTFTTSEEFNEHGVILSDLHKEIVRRKSLEVHSDEEDDSSDEEDEYLPDELEASEGEEEEEDEEDIDV